MAGLKKFVLVLQSGSKRLDFLTMYELDFVLFWVASLEEAEARIAHNDFDYALVDVDSDQEGAAKFCERVASANPRIKVVFLKNPVYSMPSNFCADLVIENTATEEEIAGKLEGLLRPHRKIG